MQQSCVTPAQIKKIMWDPRVMWIPLELSNPVLCEPTKNRMEESNLSLHPPGPNILRQLQDKKISRPITEEQGNNDNAIYAPHITKPPCRSVPPLPTQHSRRSLSAVRSAEERELYYQHSSSRYYRPT